MVWVIVDSLTKSTHFLAVLMTFTLEEFCKLYIRVPVSIVLDQDPRFTARLLESFQQALGP